MEKASACRTLAHTDKSFAFNTLDQEKQKWKRSQKSQYTEYKLLPFSKKRLRNIIA